MEEQKRNPAAGLSESEQVQVRRQKLADLQAAGNDPFTLTKFPQDAYSADLKEEFKELPNETDSGKLVALAGRMMSKRVMGKASFAHLRDDKGDIQLYVRRDELGDEAYAAFKKLDVGDIIGVKGEVFRTKTGELSVRATELTLLAKSLRPLPEKFHGLTDTEMRYRQRYVDLIANPEVKDTFIKLHSYNTYALFIEKHTGLPVYWSYTNSGDQDGRKIPGNRNTEFLENMELKDIPDSCFYPAQADKIRYVASFDEFVQEVKVGDEAPAYELTDVMTGKVYSNASLQGKIVVMQFTSTGCVGCVLAQPWMNKLYDRWKEQPELVFLCAGLLSEKDAKIQVEKYEFAYPMTTCNQAFFWSFGVQAIPSYYVIGKDNQVLARPQSHIGLKNFLDSYFNK